MYPQVCLFQDGHIVGNSMRVESGIRSLPIAYGRRPATAGRSLDRMGLPNLLDLSASCWLFQADT